MIRVTKLSSTNLERHQLPIEQQKGTPDSADRSEGYETMAWTSSDSMSEVTFLYLYSVFVKY